MQIPRYDRQVEGPQQRASQAQAPAPLRQAYGEDVAQATGQLGNAIANTGVAMVNIEKNKMLVLEKKLDTIAKQDLALAKQSSTLDEYNQKQKDSLEYMQQTAKDYLGNTYTAWEQRVGKELFNQTNLAYDLNKIPFIKEQQLKSFADLREEYASNWHNSNEQERLNMATSFSVDLESSNLSPMEQKKEMQKFQVSCFNNEILNANPLNYERISKEIIASDLDEDRKYLLQRRLLTQASTPLSKGNPDFVKSLEQRITNGTIDDSAIQALYTKGDITKTERNSLLRQYNAPYNQEIKAGETEIKKFIVTNNLSPEFERQSAKQQIALDTYHSMLVARNEDIRKGKIRPIQIAQQIVADLNSDYIADKQSYLTVPSIMKQIGKNREDMKAYSSQQLADAMVSLERRRNTMPESEYKENASLLTMWYEMAMLRESNQLNNNREGN